MHTEWGEVSHRIQISMKGNKCCYSIFYCPSPHAPTPPLPSSTDRYRPKSGLAFVRPLFNVHPFRCSLFTTQVHQDCTTTMASSSQPTSLPPKPNESASTSVPQQNVSSHNQPINASRTSVRGVGRGVSGGGGRYHNTGGRGGSQGPAGGRGRNHPHNNAQTTYGNHQSTQPEIRPVNEVPYGYLPAFLPGAASMVEQLDRKLLVILRDGRHLVGVLRTFDQYSNMVLHDTSERRILVVTKKDNMDDDEVQQPPSSKTICYQTDIELGLFIVRGDNVVLFGEVEDEEESKDSLVRFVSLEEFQQIEEEEEQRKESGGERGSEPVNWDFDTDLVA